MRDTLKGLRRGREVLHEVDSDWDGETRGRRKEVSILCLCFPRCLPIIGRHKIGVHTGADSEAEHEWVLQDER